MYRIYLAVKRDGLDYHLAYIAGDFDFESKEPFDMEYMNKLYELGFSMAKRGYPWETLPPGWNLSEAISPTRQEVVFRKNLGQ